MEDCCKYDDLINLMCGEELGSGISRKVFVCRLNPKWVVKVEFEDRWYQNIKEYMIWEEISEWKKMSKWYAPVHHISDSGRILIQQRTIPARLEDIPDKVPAHFTDQKLENYGMIDGQFVCHDYGTTILSKYWSNRLKKHDFQKEF